MKTRKMVLIQGKGTDQEKRIKTNITMYWSDTMKAWVTIPGRSNNNKMAPKDKWAWKKN
jgi:hypothetical protein